MIRQALNSRLDFYKHLRGGKASLVPSSVTDLPNKGRSVELTCWLFASRDISIFVYYEKTDV